MTIANEEVLLYHTQIHNSYLLLPTQPVPMMDKYMINTAVVTRNA